jgi:DNA repair exonuclease SbcCD ATPase subunit
MAITKDQIFAAADELDATGQNPTLAAVRKALGGGSFTTISEAMTEWKARKAAKESPLREPAPPAIAERLVEFGAEIWAIALELANARLASEREALEAARTELEAERGEAAELADQVSAELEEAKTALGQAATAEATARGERDALRQQLADVRLQAATFEARVGEIEKRAGDLNTELGRVNQQNTELVAALAAVARSGASARTDEQNPA